MTDYLTLAARQLNGRRATLLEELTKVDKAIAALSEISSLPPDTVRHPPDAPVPVPGGAGRFAGKGLREATEVLLGEREIITPPEIVKALREGGFQSTSKHLNPSVHTTLRRMIAAGEAEKMEGGAYRKATK